MSASGIGAAVSPRALKIVGAVITAVWFFSIMMDAFVATYDPPASIGLAFMAMVSAVLGSLALKGRDDKPENTERKAANKLDAVEEGES